MLFTGSFTALEIYCRVNIQEGYQLIGESLSGGRKCIIM